jgi:hypothetical protein
MRVKDAEGDPYIFFVDASYAAEIIPVEGFERNV